jgi:hypothetical protein
MNNKSVLAIYRLESGTPCEIIDEIEKPIEMNAITRDKRLQEEHGSDIWPKWQAPSGQVTPRKLK